MFSEDSQDTVGLISVNRLPVRALDQWSCFIKTKKCPLSHSDEDETLQHLLLDCYRTVETRDRMVTKQVSTLKRIQKSFLWPV